MIRVGSRFLARISSKDMRKSHAPQTGIDTKQQRKIMEWESNKVVKPSPTDLKKDPDIKSSGKS